MRERRPTEVTAIAARPLSLAVWLLAAAALAIVLYVRLRLLGFPLERDEGEYAYAGQLLLQKVAPYQLAYNMKFPGTYAAYAVLMAVFGQTTVGVHLGLLCVNLGAVGCLFVIARRWLGPLAGALAAAFYGVLSLSPWVAGLSAHATHFVVLAMLAGTVYLTGRTVGKGALLAAGFLFGLAILLKQPGALFVPFGLGLMVLNDRRESRAWPQILVRSALFLAAVFLPVAATFALLWWSGVFPRFWFWTMDYARSYGSMLSLSDGFGQLAANLPQIIEPMWGLWILAGAGLIGIWFNAAWRRSGIALTSLLVFSAGAVCPGLYFREHYFILVLPAVASLAAAGVMILLRCKLAPAIFGSVAFLTAAAAIAQPLYRDRQLLFQLSPDEVSKTLYWPNPFAEVVRVADFLRERTTASDTIAVLGSEPEIYFYAQRHSATGYIYTYPLMEPHARAAAMQREMIEEITRARPKYLVIVGVEASWLRRAGSDQTIFNWANEYCARDFVLAGSVNLLSSERDDFFLPATGAVDNPSPNYLLVYERRADR